MFDLGTEVFIKPILWGVIALGVLIGVIASWKRIKIETEEGDLQFTKWKFNKARFKRVVTVGVVGILALSSLVVVPPGHRGAVYTTNGVSTTERGEGYSFVVPLVHNVSMVNVREQLYSNEEVFGQTKDVLEVTMQVGVNYTITPDKAADIFQAVGQNYEQAIIENAVLDIGKQVIGNYDASIVPSQRGAITTDMLLGLRERLEPVGITVTFVALRDIILPKSFVAAVEAKEVADEKALESERLVRHAINEAQQVRERAQGEADALTIVAEAKREEQALLGMSPTEYVWFKTWNGALPLTLLGTDGEFIVNLP